MGNFLETWDCSKCCDYINPLKECKYFDNETASTIAKLICKYYPIICKDAMRILEDINEGR